MTPAARPQQDTREAQARRVADYLEHHPDASAREIATACDPGSVTKALSDMARPGGLGYGIGKGWRREPCDQGNHTRRVRTYRLLHRPGRQPDLFQTQ